MASNRDIKMEDCLATEMAANPSGYFDEEGKNAFNAKGKTDRGFSYTDLKATCFTVSCANL